MEAPRVWLIAGPTASGKSALARRLADATGATIVNADALQIYRDLRILTARPSPAEEREAPHALYGVAEATDAWSVGLWLRAVLPIIESVTAKGRRAILVGGTGLYFAALTRGLADVPEVDEAVRAACAARFDAEGEAAFRARLEEVDAAAAASIAPGDRQRLVRAFSVHGATGRSLSDWWRAPTSPLPVAAWRGVVLAPERAALYAACDARLERMLAEGALEEVASLVARDLDPALSIMKATGLRELVRHLAGEISRDEALGLAQRETRRYAKRQATWFRHQAASWPRLERGSSAELAAAARAVLEHGDAFESGRG